MEAIIHVKATLFFSTCRFFFNQFKHVVPKTFSIRQRGFILTVHTGFALEISVLALRTSEVNYGYVVGDQRFVSLRSSPLL